MSKVQSAIVDRINQSGQTLDFTIADLTSEQLHAIHEGATIGSPASIYVHTTWVQDLFINKFLRGEATVFDAQGWGEKLPGVDPHAGSSLEWAKSVKVTDPAALMAYAAAVRANAADYVASLSDDDLDTDVEFFMGPTARITVLLIMLWDTANHTGEIAALRGVSGLQGLPF